MDQLEEFDIRQYLDALKRRWWVIATAIMLCATSALTYSFLAPKIYESTAKVLISAQQDTSGTGNALSAPNQLQNQMQTQVEIATSEAVKAEADRLLGADSAQIIGINATGVTNTRVMEISAQSEDPLIAQRAAEIYAQTYLAAGTRTAVDRVTAIGESVNEKKAELQAQVNQINTQSTVNVPESVLAERGQRVAQLQTQIEQIQRQYDNAQAEALVREAAAAPFAAATLPESPVSPQPARNAALAIVLGALIGIGIALAWERLDDRLRSAERFSRWFPNVPVLATIPRVLKWKNRDEARNLTLHEPRSVTAEAYRSLRTSLDFIALDQNIKVLEVTSSASGEGKSTTVANLATAIAWTGRNVIVVSADLRRPRIHQFFGVPNDRGLTDALLNGNRDLDTLMQTADLDTVNTGSVRILGTGSLPPNPSEILGSSSVKDLISKLRDMADVIILDAPPILPVADPLVLSQFADAVLLVANANAVNRKELQRAFDTASKSLQAPIVGVVINDSEEATAYATKYGYQAAEPASATLPPVTPSSTNKPESTNRTETKGTTTLVGSVVDNIIEQTKTDSSTKTTKKLEPQVDNTANTESDKQPDADVEIIEAAPAASATKTTTEKSDVAKKIEPTEKKATTRKGLRGRRTTKENGTTKSEPISQSGS